MKKLALLTSVLALAACGGGSGGGSNGGVPGTVPGGDVPGTNPPQAGNVDKITSLLPEITVDGPDGQKTYTLEDVKFFDPSIGSEEGYLTFGLDDNGEIDSIKIMAGDTIAGNATRVDNGLFSLTTGFKYKVSGIEGGQDYYTTDIMLSGDYTTEAIINAFESVWADKVSPEIMDAIKAKVANNDIEREEIDYDLAVELYGKSVGLKYSDFGYNTMSSPDDPNDSSAMFGGYEVKRIDNPVFTDKMTFTGKAIAALSRNGKNAEKIIATDDNATTLNFDNGKATLTMPFNDWYSIIVENPNSQKYMFRYDGETKIGYDLNGIDNANINVIYYGDNNAPTEAVGGISFDNNGVEFKGAFGVAKK